MRELLFLRAQLSALKMQPTRGERTLDEAQRDCLAAKQAVTVGVPEVYETPPWFDVDDC